MILPGILKILSSIFELRYSLYYIDLNYIWFQRYSFINRQFQCFKYRSVKPSYNFEYYMIKKCYTSEVFFHQISPNIIRGHYKRQYIMKKYYFFLVLPMKQCNFYVKSNIFQGKDHMVILCWKISCLLVQKTNFCFKIPAKLRRSNKSYFSPNYSI